MMNEQLIRRVVTRAIIGGTLMGVALYGLGVLIWLLFKYVRISWI